MLPAGSTFGFIPITVLSDDEVEEPLLFGEWGVIDTAITSGNAVLDDSIFFGAGLFVILDDD
ncbi:MAG: hypothetical protein AAF548_07785 [Actinomycetota bacterium]